MQEMNIYQTNDWACIINGRQGWEGLRFGARVPVAPNSANSAVESTVWPLKSANVTPNSNVIVFENPQPRSAGAGTLALLTPQSRR